MVSVVLGYPDSEHLSENDDEITDDLLLPKPARPFPYEKSPSG
jgi:hypothetical protein